MSLARRAREAYNKRFDKNTIEESLAYVASNEINTARENFEREVAHNPLENAERTVGAQDIITGGGGEFIDPENHEMHGLTGSHLNEEAKYYVFEDGSILMQDENGNFQAQLFNKEVEQEINDFGYYPGEEGDIPRKDRDNDLGPDFG